MLCGEYQFGPHQIEESNEDWWEWECSTSKVRVLMIGYSISGINKNEF